MQKTVFTLSGLTTYKAAAPTIENITSKLKQQVQLSQLELVSWSSTGDTVTYHGITQQTNKPVILTVHSDGVLYAQIGESKSSIKVGKIYAD